MSGTAKKTDPKLWDKVKTQVTKSNKGGKPGQWSARKAQMATAEYKKEGGGYAGKKADDNHLKQWTDEEWGTKSGKASGKTGKGDKDTTTKAELMRKARAQNVPGRSRMSKAQLEHAVHA